MIQAFTTPVLAQRLARAAVAAMLGWAAPVAMAETLVNVDTSVGSFQLSLDDVAAPETVANFLSYITSGRLNDTFVHRLAPGFVIQGGGFYSDAAFTPVPTDAPIALEASGLKNVRGTIAMARTYALDSATSQWFINTVDNAPLDGAYTVFGSVVGQGMSVVDTIAALPNYNLTNTYGPVFTNVPLIAADGGQGFYVVNTRFTVVPEPQAAWLMGLGLAGVAALARERRQRHLCHQG
jgi:peptidyl-prolyl cis-trans isomerase A (cyclophilin A)